MALVFLEVPSTFKRGGRSYPLVPPIVWKERVGEKENDLRNEDF